MHVFSNNCFNVIWYKFPIILFCFVFVCVLISFVLISASLNKILQKHQQHGYAQTSLNATFHTDGYTPMVIRLVTVCLVLDSDT